MLAGTRSAFHWFAAVSLVLACGRGGDTVSDSAATTLDMPPPAEAAERARNAANALGRDLQTRLFAALDSGGPGRAIAFCSDSAQAWTARHAREGVYVRRVSLRVRNPLNAPDAAEERELLRLDSLQRAGALPAEVLRTARTAPGDSVVEYLRPIIVQERCLACHGERERIAPAVRSILDARYPTDQATGYRTGDLRGALSVRVPLHPGGGAR